MTTEKITSGEYKMDHIHKMNQIFKELNYINNYMTKITMKFYYNDKKNYNILYKLFHDSPATRNYILFCSSNSIFKMYTQEEIDLIWKYIPI